MSRLKEIRKNLAERQGLAQKILKYFLLSLVLLALIFSASYFASLPGERIFAVKAKLSPEEAEKIIDNIVFDGKTGSFKLETVQGFIWESSVDEELAGEDEIAKGLARLTMFSQLVIRYADSDNRIYTPAASGNARVDIEKPEAKSHGDAYPEAGESYLAVYTFTTGKASEGRTIKIPVRYDFYDDSMRVIILTDEIEENDEYRLLDISILPFFGSAGPEEQGFIFIPDGSGALIDFSQNKEMGDSWEQPVYGRDPSLKTVTKKEKIETVRLPVFGMKRGTSGFLAIIEQGQALASVTAQSYGYNSQRYNVYPTFRYREYDRIILNEMSGNERDVDYVNKNPSSSGDFSVLYTFLEGESLDYPDLAVRYRNYLVAQEPILAEKKNIAPSLYLTAFMSVGRVKPVMGLPVKAVDKLTSFSDLEEIGQELLDRGVKNLKIRMSFWQEGAHDAKIQHSTGPQAKLGGKKDFKGLLQWADQREEVDLFPAIDLVEASKAGKGFSPFFQGNRDVAGALSLQFDYLKSTGTKNLRREPAYLVNPYFSVQMLASYVDKLAPHKNNYGGIALDQYGDKVYSDLYNSFLDKAVARRAVDRQTAADLWVAAMDYSREKAGRLMLDGGNSYAFGHADHILEIPMESGYHKIATGQIPFYQIATTGIINTASGPINFEQDPDAFLLKCLETGVSPHYYIMLEASSLVKNTGLNYLYNGEFSLWQEKIVNGYKTYEEAYSKISGACIEDHKIYEDGRTLTVFENGLELLIDHNEQSFEIREGVN